MGLEILFWVAMMGVIGYFGARLARRSTRLPNRSSQALDRAFERHREKESEFDRAA